MIQKFTILGNPRGQGRPKATVRGRHASVYEDSKDRIYKENLAAQVVAQKPNFISGDLPVQIQVHFFLSRPQYHYGVKGLKERFLDARPLGKPDLDNMVKAVKDSLKGIVWHDDSQVVKIDAEKFFADAEPQIAIWIKSPTVVS